MVGRRLLILVAVLMGLTALAASVAPPPDGARRNGTAPAAPARAPARPTAEAATVTADLDAATRPDRVDARVGQIVSLVVRADLVDAVVIDGLDAIDAVDPASPAEFAVYADTPGRYPVRLLGRDRRVGELVVSR
jgi:hypothetical protein